MGESKPQEVQFGKQPPTDSPDVQFGKTPETAETVERTPGDDAPSSSHNTGVVPEYAGGDPVPDDADSDADDADSDASESE